ncbi:hypothetical protein SFUMM280S_05840 [Streptomyces fumanus]
MPRAGDRVVPDGTGRVMIRRAARRQDDRHPGAAAGGAPGPTVSTVEGVHLVHDGDAPPAALLEAAVTLRDEPAGRATVLVAAVPGTGNSTTSRICWLPWWAACAPEASAGCGW